MMSPQLRWRSLTHVYVHIVYTCERNLRASAAARRCLFYFRRKGNAGVIRRGGRRAERFG